MNHKIDFDVVAKGLGISRKNTINFFNDGRVMGRLGEFILDDKNSIKRVANENSPFDNVDSDGRRIEVRAITKKISFASSKETGFGRSVTETGFKEKIDSVDYFYCLDFLDDISNIKFVVVSSEFVMNMVNSGILGKNKSMSRKKFLKQVNK